MIRLKSLYVADYKILKDFKLKFEDRQAVTVLLGTNGAGKSTVLECLAWIVRGLHEKYLHSQKPILPFDFELRYEVGSAVGTELPEKAWDELMLKEVVVIGQKEQDDYRLDLTLLAGAATKRFDTELFSYPTPEEKSELLPNLAVYYSGLSDTIERIYTEYESKQLDSSWRKPQQDIATYARATALPLYYLQRGDFPLLLAALFAFEVNFGLDDFLTNRMRGLRKPETPCITIVVKRPAYYTGSRAAKVFKVLAEGEVDFWGTEGLLRQFLQQLSLLATEKKEVSGEATYSYKFDTNAWYSLREENNSEHNILALMLLLRANDTLASVEVLYQRGNLVAPHTTLSEGEQQLLLVRAINELLVQEQTIVLLDEPDTFLHPQWQARFIEEITPFTNESSFIITTHSPVLLSNLKKGNVHLMQEGIIRTLDGHYYGREYGHNLEDIMNVSSRPAEVVVKLQELFETLDAENWNLGEEQLRMLSDELGADDADLVRARAILDFLM